MNQINKTPTISPKGIYILGLLYILSPIDFLPDFFPFVGWLDDLGVLAYMVQTYRTSRQTLDATFNGVTSISNE